MRRTNVLMVEDELLISEMISGILCENGFDVHAVTNGATALRYLDDGREVDVLFTDINIEGRMDGSMLAKQAHEGRPEMPIVYCSGRYSASALAPLMSRSLFLKNPYNLADLCTLLAQLTSGER